MSKKSKVLKVFEAFTGYGGAHYGLKRTKLNFEIVGISEIDKFAIELSVSWHQKFWWYK